MIDQPQGKPCPDCREPMSDLRSLNIRQCTNGRCGLLVCWNLAAGQAPLISGNRASRRSA